MDELPRYREHPLAITQLNRRHEAIVAPFIADIQDATVIDLASHDRRWAYALAQAGAKEVLDIEARQSLIDQFDDYPHAAVKDRVSLVRGDIFVQIEQLFENNAIVDVVAVFGIFHHITEHYRLLHLITRLRPSLIIIDSEFARNTERPVLRVDRERTDNPLNTTDRRAGEVELVAVASPQLLDLMADVLG